METVSESKEDGSPAKSNCKICDSLNKIVDDEMAAYKSASGKMKNYVADVCKNSKRADVQLKVTVNELYLIVNPLEPVEIPT